MKLIDLIKDIENISDEAIIFQEDRENPYSDIILSYAEDGDRGTKEVEGKTYYYLIEVFLTKEFLRDLDASSSYKSTLDENAKRLHEYANNDA